MIIEGIHKLTNGLNLTYHESKEIMTEIMSGSTTQAQIGAFLTALRIKGETIQEISAFASAMKEFCHQIHPKVKGRLVDTCGTGGDKIKTFNISTTTAFVVAGAEVSVAKHGNRSVTSKSGCADVLEKLGVSLNATPNTVERNIEEVGIGFMFAPTFHRAMKHVSRPRREIGLRTVFNVLGPLTNPANANAHLLGVYDIALVEHLAHVLKELECEEAMVVHGKDGLDEISTIGRTVIAWLRGGEIDMLEVAPEDFGLKKTDVETIVGTTPQKSAETTFKILHGYNYEDPKKDIVLANAAAGILVGGKSDDFLHGVELARESINSGAAYRKLKMLVKASGGDATNLEEMELKHG